MLTSLGEHEREASGAFTASLVKVEEMGVMTPATATATTSQELAHWVNTRVRRWLGVISALIDGLEYDWVLARVATIPVTRAVIAQGSTDGKRM